MADRHRDEIAALGRRQALRRDAELARFDSAETAKEVAEHPERADEIRRAGKQRLEGRLQELEEAFASERADFLDELEVEFVEEQMQLKLTQWNEVSEAS